MSCKLSRTNHRKHLTQYHDQSIATRILGESRSNVGARGILELFPFSFLHLCDLLQRTAVYFVSNRLYTSLPSDTAPLGYSLAALARP